MSPSRFFSDREREQAVTPDEVEALAAAHPEFAPATDEELAAAVAVSSDGRERVPISIRLDREVLEYFRAGGRGYQTRINAVLREHMERETRQGVTLAAMPARFRMRRGGRGFRRARFGFGPGRE